MARVVRTQQPDEGFLLRLAQEYENAKSFAESAQKRADELKAQLSATVDSQGTPDDKGNLWLNVGRYALKRERRVSKSLNTGNVQTWAEQHGCWEDVTRIERVVDEDKLLKMAWEIPDIADDIAALYTEKEIWAFRFTENKIASQEDI